MELRKVYDELNEQLQHLKQQVAALGTGGTKDYSELDNKPSINGITLSGYKYSDDLKIAKSMTETQYTTAQKYSQTLYCLTENEPESHTQETVPATNFEWTADGDNWVSDAYLVHEENATSITVTTTTEGITLSVTGSGEDRSVILTSSIDPETLTDIVIQIDTVNDVGATRMVKNGIPFGKSYTRDLLHGSATLAYPASQTADITLSGNMDDYDDIMIVCGWTADDVLGYKTFQTPSALLMQTSSASSDIDKQFLCDVNSKETQWVRVSKGTGANKLHFRFNGNVGVYQVYGIKF